MQPIILDQLKQLLAFKSKKVDLLKLKRKYIDHIKEHIFLTLLFVKREPIIAIDDGAKYKCIALGAGLAFGIETGDVYFVIVNPTTKVVSVERIRNLEDLSLKHLRIIYHNLATDVNMFIDEALLMFSTDELVQQDTDFLTIMPEEKENWQHFNELFHKRSIEEDEDQ